MSNKTIKKVNELEQRIKNLEERHQIPDTEDSTKVIFQGQQDYGHTFHIDSVPDGTKFKRALEFQRDNPELYSPDLTSEERRAVTQLLLVWHAQKLVDDGYGHFFKNGPENTYILEIIEANRQREIDKITKN